MSLRSYLSFAVFILIFNSYSISQFSLQTSYKIGFYDLESLTKGNMIHRFDLIGEYELKNRFLFSIKVGRHIYVRKSDHRTTSDEGSSIVYTHKKFHQKRYANSLNLAVGYRFEINDRHSIVSKIYSGFSNLSGVKTFEATSEVREVSKTEENTLFYSKEFGRRFNLKEAFDYPNRFISAVDPITLSLEYRFKIRRFSLIGTFGYSPFKPPLYYTKNTSGLNDIIQFGFTFGYTFPQKSEKDEK